MTKSPSSILLFEEAEKRNYQPIWKTDYGFFTFLYQGKVIYVYQTKNYGNNQLLTWLTSDKYATRILLEDYKLPNIPFFYSTNRKELLNFFEENNPLISKPVLGEMAKEVVLVKEKSQLANISLGNTIFEKFINGDEYRILLLKGEVEAIQRKELISNEKHPWRKKRINLSRNDLDKTKKELVSKIYELIPQTILAVDIIEDEKNKNWILELNSMPGLWSFSNPHEGKPIHLASKFLDVIVETQTK